MIKLDELLKEKKDLEVKINAINLMIQAYRNDEDIELEHIEPIIKYESKLNSGVMEKGTWLEQILYVISEKKRFMHNSEMAFILKPNYKNKDMNQVKRRISSVLATALSKNKVDSLVNYRFTKSKQDTVWGKKDWLDENGRIKKEHMYFDKESNKNQIRVSF